MEIIIFFVKYGPWYWIRPLLLCQDRSAEDRHCACFPSYYIITSETSYSDINKGNSDVFDIGSCLYPALCLHCVDSSLQSTQSSSAWPTFLHSSRIDAFIVGYLTLFDFCLFIHKPACLKSQNVWETPSRCRLEKDAHKSKVVWVGLLYRSMPQSQSTPLRMYLICIIIQLNEWHSNEIMETCKKMYIFQPLFQSLLTMLI